MHPDTLMRFGRMRMIEAALRELRTVRIAILLVSAAIAVLGFWKRSQDLDELAFVQAQVKRANDAGAPAPAPSPAKEQKARDDHRSALLKITQKERELQKVKDREAAAASLQDTIRHDVQQMLARTASTFNVADTVWYQFETSREREVRRALIFDLLLQPLALSGFLCGIVIWRLELKRKQSTVS